ncbi:MAG: heavy-metal-associated domain-containing protein [Leptospiraceae bacterium]|nr:heavy-metal-associated domain-containing protein [Leptospiraceae bacterium]
MKTLYKIEGMTCGHCMMTVEKEFAKAGVSAKADRITDSVSVESELDAATYQKLQAVLEEEGYSLGNKIES